MKKFDWKRVALKEVGNVAVEAFFRIVVGEQTHVGEFPAEDFEMLLDWMRIVVGVWGNSLLSDMNTIDFAFEPPSGAATYVWRLSIVSTFPVGVPSCTLPERQHELIPTPVDILIFTCCY